MGDTAADVASTRYALGQLGDRVAAGRWAGRQGRRGGRGRPGHGSSLVVKTLEQRRAIESSLARYQDLDSAIAQTRAERATVIAQRTRRISAPKRWRTPCPRPKATWQRPRRHLQSDHPPRPGRPGGHRGIRRL